MQISFNAIAGILKYKTKRPQFKKTDKVQNQLSTRDILSRVIMRIKKDDKMNSMTAL